MDGSTAQREEAVSHSALHHSREVLQRHISGRDGASRGAVALFITMPNGNTITFKMKTSDTIGDVKDAIAGKLLIPSEQLTLKIAGKPNIVLADPHWLSAYIRWNLSVLDMILEITATSGEFYVRVCCDHEVRSDRPFPNNMIASDILKVNNFDTIKTVKNQMYVKLGIKVDSEKFQCLRYPQSLEPHLTALAKVGILLPPHDITKGNEQSHEQDPALNYDTLFGINDKYTELSNGMTLEHYVSLFQQLLKLCVSLLHTEDDGEKHVYSVQIPNDTNTSHHNPNDYFLSVEYNTTVNKLYSMVADHYKISVREHVVLMMNGYQILCGDTELHVLFYPPVIRYTDHFMHCVPHGSHNHLLSEFGKCHNPAHCTIAKKINDDPIIKEMVSVRNDAWEVIIKVFNISDDIRKKIKANSEDNRIRCMDVMHRMYHHDDDLTWEFVEIQMRREFEDQQLADVIRTHL